MIYNLIKKICASKETAENTYPFSKSSSFESGLSDLHYLITTVLKKNFVKPGQLGIQVWLF